MTAASQNESRLSAPDARPLVVTVAVVGYLLLYAAGALNSFVVLVNGSPQVTLYDTSAEDPFDEMQRSSEYAEFLPPPPDPAFRELERIASAGFLLVAVAGVAGAIALYKRNRWSRVVLWATTASAIGADAAYRLRVLQLQSAPILDAAERQDAFELAAQFALLNVAIQAIPLVVLAGLLRHPAVRAYVFGPPE
jgi:hypothetical protein